MNRLASPVASLPALCIGVDTNLADGTNLAPVRQMKLGQPLLTTDMSGSLGGLTAAKARGGVLYARARVRPSNPNSGPQSQARNALTSVAAAWRSELDAAQRAAWDNLATGDKSGIDLFMAPNALRKRAGQAIIEDAPETLAAIFTQPSGVVITDEGLIDATLTATDTFNATTGGAVHVFATRPQSESRLSRQFPFTYAGSVIRNLAAVNVSDMQYPYPNPSVGDIVYLRFITTTSDGRISGDYIFRVAVTAP
jgi:hypothetical protein